MYWHASGYWAKTIRTRTEYFGDRGSVSDGPEFDAKAKSDFEANFLALKSGLPRVSLIRGGDMLVEEVVADFLISRQKLLELEEIRVRTFREYKRVGKIVADAFRGVGFESITHAHLMKLRDEYGTGRSPKTLGNMVRSARIIFNYGRKILGLDFCGFGEFTEPTKKTMRKNRNQKKREHGLKMFEREQLLAVLDSELTRPQLRAMVLLGVNAAYGNSDCSELERSQLKENAAGETWLDVERGKTEIDRRCLLWPETVAAIKAVEPIRPKAEDPKHRDRVFLTITGKPWVRDETSNTDQIATEFAKLLTAIELDGKPLKRPGLSFYALRHTTQTIGDRTRDRTALDVILGHADSSMAAVYNERIDDDRLAAVSHYIRKWLFQKYVEGDRCPEC